MVECWALWVVKGPTLAYYHKREDAEASLLAIKALHYTTPLKPLRVGKTRANTKWVVIHDGPFIPEVPK